jgi:hypothetical protein
LPDDSTIVWCVAESICYDISGWDPDASDSITMSLFSGPIEFETQTFGREFTTTVCFLPEADGDYEFVWKFTDRQFHVVYDTVVYTVETGLAPTIEDQYFYLEACDLRTDRILPLEYTGEGAGLLFELISGPGSIDARTGVITYRPDTSGVFLFEVGLTSECGGDTAAITDELVLNLPPHCIGFDSTIYWCDLQSEVCFDVFAFDPEGDPISISMLEGLGTFTQTTDTSGVTCFTPADEDSARYIFIYRSADPCTLGEGEALSEPYCCLDTVKIDIIITRPGELSCPPDTTVALCVPPMEMPFEICIPGFTSTWETTTVSVGAITDETLCFTADTLGVYTIEYAGSDTCGHSEVCTTTVTVRGNSEPYVSMADDYAISLCVPETICFTATADDLDFDIAEVQVSYGYFEQSTGRICFLADTSGVYTITMTATDECGSTASGTTTVTVDMNTPPNVDLGDDRFVSLCNPEEICIDAAVTGDRITYFSTSTGAHYDEQTGQVCFTPDTAGVYEVFLRANDACEMVTADTVQVEVALGHAPVITGLPDTSMYVCYPTTICLPFDIEDLDDDVVSVTVNRGKIQNGTVCFVPYTQGIYEVVLTATDACGHVATDTATVEITTDQDIEIVCPGDTTVFLCEPDTLCFPIGGVPAGATVTVDGIATYWDAETQSICFYSDCCLENDLTVSVTTKCGTYSCSFRVSVQTNTRPMVLLPADTTVLLCEPGPICLPVGISDIDGNVATVKVFGGVYDAYANTICFDAAQEGVYSVMVEVADSCGAIRTDDAQVTVEFNDPPWIESLFEDDVISACDLSPISIYVDYGDPNGDPVSIGSPDTDLLIIDPETGRVVGVSYTPDAFGYQCVQVMATDICGLADTVDICFTISPWEPVHIPNLDPIVSYQCGPGEFCIDLPVSGDNFTVAVDKGTWNNHRWCIDVDQRIEGELTIIATGPCNADTAVVPLLLWPVDSPLTKCPGDLDTLLCGPDTLVFELPLLGGAGPDEMVEVSAPAWVEVVERIAYVYVPFPEPGQETITVTHSSDPCEPSVCSFTVTAAVNAAPQLTAENLTLDACELAEICVPFQYFDAEGNIVEITSSAGELTYDLGDGQVCFVPDAFGEHLITLTALDACGKQTAIVVSVTINELPTVAIDCPMLDAPLTFCEPGPHCIGLPITGDPVSVTTSLGIWEDGQLCFDLIDLQPGDYNVEVTAVGACNTAVCTIPIRYLSAALVTCLVPDTTLLYCEAVSDIVKMPVAILGDGLTIEIQPSGYEFANGMVNVPVNGAGSYPVTVIASNDCSADTCDFVVTVEINSTPTVNLGDDVTFTQCLLEKVCVHYQVTDIDDNLYELRTNRGVIVNGDVCFTPTEFGTFELILSAEDQCGAFGYDTVQITIEPGDYVTMTCPPELTSINIDLPGTVRVPIGIDLPEAIVTVSPNGTYDFETGEAVVSIESEGLHEFLITAEAPCNTDSCKFFIEVGEYIPPHVECRGTVDSLLCLSQPRTVCLPISVFGSDVQVQVSAPATYDGEAVCLEVSEEGEYVIDIMAFTDRDTVTCQTVLTATGGNPPLLEMPAAFDYTLCQPGEVCFDVVMEDAEFDISNIAVSYGSYDIATGRLCFAADTAGVYEIEMLVSDSCGNAAGGLTAVTVDFNDMPSISLGDDQTIFGCELSEICVDVIVSDDDLVSVISNLGVYNASSGQVCFTPEAAGEYELIVTATDQCGTAVSDSVMIDVGVNRPPVMAPLRDTTLYMCYPTEVCLDVDLSDPDGNLASVTTSRGTYADGRVCFIPYSNGEYPIIVTGTDECGMTVVDTALVTIITDQGIQLVCPEDTTVFLCEPTTLCFPIGGIPEGAQVTVRGIASYWDAETQSVCFVSDCCLVNKLTVTVATECGSYSCSFTVSVQTNSRPLVLLPKDTTILQCQLGPICLPIGISDIDGNIMAVEVEGADYDDYANQVCFTPDMVGSHFIGVTVTDSCGLVSTDEMLVNVVLNEAPTISYTPDGTIYKQCVPEEICVPIGVSDFDDNIADISVVGGRYDAATGSVCIMPEGVGTFCAQVTVTDDCGLTDSEEVCVTVAAGDHVEIACNETPEPPQALCEPGTVCFPVPITGDNFTVTTDFGNWDNDVLCFTADTTGTYVVTVIADAQCISDTCTVTVPIVVLEPLAVSCPESDSVFVCGESLMAYDFTYAPASAEVTVSAPAYFEGGRIWVPIDQPGTQTVTVTVANHCGSVECSFDVKAVFNVGPTVALGPDLNLTECDLNEVCIPVSWTDPDQNGREVLVMISPDAPGITATDSEICFTPPDYGVYQIIYVGSDDCAASDADTVTVNYTRGKYASIQCPDGAQYASICGADTVCILAPIFDAESITILPNGVYKPLTGEVCVYVTQGGTHQITIIAEATCESDTCTFNLEVDLGLAPALVCPDPIDTLLCLVEPDTLRVPITASGTGLQVNVNPTGYYSAGVVNLPISTAGNHIFEVIAFGSCGADTCEIEVDVTADQAPVLYLPETMTFERCPDDADPICIGGIFAIDAESDVVITKMCGPGEFTGPSADSGGVCFVPTSFGEIELCFEADDGCHAVGGSMTVNVVVREDCDVCVRLAIDGGEETPVGLRKSVAVNIETNDAIGGFDLLIGYDASALTYLAATMQDGAAEEWEYFTWSVDNAGCGTACPSGIVRFVGIADRNNGAAHPPTAAYSPDGTLFFMEFQVANDQNLGDQYVPISFVWRDCADNAASDTTGTLLYLDTRIYRPDHTLLWDESDDVNFPESSREFGIGSPDTCLVGDKTQAARCVEFVNGGIKIIDPDDIDARGDINLNNIAYEIADAVVFTNYFIRGLSAFTINVAGQIAATDVNADGLTLTVSDLALLIRIIIGDASPVPKTAPYAEEAEVVSRVSDGQLNVGATTAYGLGAAYFVYEIPDGVTVGEPETAAGAASCSLIHGVHDGQLHLLIYDIGTNRVDPGEQDLIRVPISGDGELTLVHTELVDYDSRPYVSRPASALPTDYDLEQNYPNPFNPSTTIAFALPAASEWKLTVYNIAGALVWESNGAGQGGRVEVVWDGSNMNGQSVASGVYLYRLDAVGYSNTRKMVLLK